VGASIAPAPSGPLRTAAFFHQAGGAFLVERDVAMRVRDAVALRRDRLDLERG